jgi:hypothetical protein
MTEDELIEEMAMEMFPTAWDADHDDPQDDGQVSKKYARFKARVGLLAIRKAVGDPLTLVAHIRELEADNKDFLEQIAVQTESVLFKESQEIMKANNALHDENARLKQLVDFADTLRAAQRAYMADRGNDQLGRAVADAAKGYYALRSLGGVRSDK